MELKKVLFTESVHEVGPELLRRAGFQLVFADRDMETVRREIRDADQLEVDLTTGEIRNLTQNKTYHFVPMPQRLLDMLEAGGLVAQLEQEK